MRSGGTQARHAILCNLLGNRPWFLKLGCTDPAGMDREPGEPAKRGEFSVLRSRLAAQPVHDVAPGQERVLQKRARASHGVSFAASFEAHSLSTRLVR